MKYSSLALQCLLFVIVLFGRITFTKQGKWKFLSQAVTFERVSILLIFMVSFIINIRVLRFTHKTHISISKF